MRYSVIIPVYNRPEEVRELLISLTKVSYKSFEVLVIEDGSTITCEHVVHEFENRLDLSYFRKENSGQGFTRNTGFEKAQGDYYVVFDSDCIIPSDYFDAVNQKIAQTGSIDCWGGPDRAHPSFTSIQKAINYSMTSVFTTGGTRGSHMHIGTYFPRSFNMGVSKEVYEEAGGYKITRMGEDLEFSIRIQNSGYQIHYIDDAFVYHKRRTTFSQFYKQLFFFGRARVNIWRFHPRQLKVIHLFPSLFLTGFLYGITGTLFDFPAAQTLMSFYGIFVVILFIDSFRSENSFEVAYLSALSGFIQLIAYGAGLLSELLKGKSIYQEVRS